MQCLILISVVVSLAASTATAERWRRSSNNNANGYTAPASPTNHSSAPWYEVNSPWSISEEPQSPPERPKYDPEPRNIQALEYNYRYALENPSTNSIRIKLNVTEENILKHKNDLYV
ncbi:MAG: hypothetical protein HY537_17520, partial [Deltaproteobacteria bacterium]|nr:hypothetical protein [Deltaproteobacteria bacterium]